MSKILYSKSHEWVEFLDENKVRIGLTAHAAEQLGDLVFINLPEEGDRLEKGEAFGDAESIKAVSDIYSPLDGEVTAVNEDVLDAPAKIGEAPMAAWLVEATADEVPEDLMDEAAYEAFCAEA